MAVDTNRVFRIYNMPEGRDRLLVRRPVGDVLVGPSLAASIERVFGKALTPDEAVAFLLDEVRQRGDEALREWTRRIDGAHIDTLAVAPENLESAYGSLSKELREALHLSIDRVREFHQRQPTHSWVNWSPEGGALGQIVRPLERIGVYAPGGTAPYPSTLIMSAVPAQVAGVSEIIVVSPPGKDGNPAPIVLAAAYACGIESVFRIGGAQSVAAMAYGTESIPKVDKIVGPGNIFVVLAKRRVYGLVDIDGLPGPTETLVVADEAASPELVAADLLAQAEHDVLASAILVTPSRELARAVQIEIQTQIQALERRDVIRESLEGQGGAVVSADLNEAVELSNLYGPEHLCLHVADPWALVGKIKNAGGIFLGEDSYEALGDYVIGPSHVMPTLGTARFASPLNVRDFTKIISLFGLDSKAAAAIGPAAYALAQAEGLTAHAAAVWKRLE
jgi:histidinol dehydrogenase